RIQNAVAHQRHVHVVQTHRSLVGPADAAEKKLVALGFRDGHVPEAPGGLPNHLDELVRGSLVLAFVRMMGAFLPSAIVVVGAEGRRRHGARERQQEKAKVYNRWTRVHDSTSRFQS